MAYKNEKIPQNVTPKRTAPQPKGVQRQAIFRPMYHLPFAHARLAQALRRTASNRTLQRLAEGESPVSPDLEERLAQNQGRGEPLEEGLRARMESALGADLSGVRIHRDATANALSGEVNARAFTLGKDVYFASGEYAPETETGQRTIAHELAHVVQQHSGPALVVGSINDPAEVEADKVANEVVSRLQREEAVSRQAEEEEEEVQTVRRQAEEEEEEEETAQKVRRQAVEMETMIDYEDEIEFSTNPQSQESLRPIRRLPSSKASSMGETAPSPLLRPAPAPQRLRRRVTVDVVTQTATQEAIQQMTTVELREQIARLRQLPELEDPQRENLARMQAELTQRESALAAADVETLERLCNRELQRLQFWMLSPGGLPLQTLRAFDSAVGNFLTNTEAGEGGGIGFADVFSVVLAAVPGVGPISRWVGSDAVRAAMVAVAQAAASATAQGVQRGVEGTTAQEERGARASFAAQVRREGAALADSLARSTDQVLSLYGGAIDSARSAGNAEGLRILLVNLQHENDAARAVGVDRYSELSRQYEIELYKRYYQSRAYIRVIEHNVWGVMSREVQGIPSGVQEALIRRLNAASSMLTLAYSWGLPERVTRTSGGRF